jgi:dienelactone hydrolase
MEQVLCPSDGPVSVPVRIVKSAGRERRRPVAVLTSEAGKSALLSETGADSAASLARQSALVVLPDLRLTGELALTRVGMNAVAWERNALLWGRSLPAMRVTDLLAVVDYVGRRPDADAARLSVRARAGEGAWGGVAVLLAAAIEDRLADVAVDLGGHCFEKRGLPTVPFILRHGDVLQWAALLGTRRLRLTGVPPEAGDPSWLQRTLELPL